MRRSALEADDERIPEWPEECVCRGCGETVWSVTGADGKRLLIDSLPLSTGLVVEGEELVRVRTSPPFSEARSVGGWVLLDPVHVRGGDCAGWHWFVARRELRVAEEEALYSEHVFSCRGASRAAVVGRLVAPRTRLECSQRTVEVARPEDLTLETSAPVSDRIAPVVWTQLSLCW